MPKIHPIAFLACIAITLTASYFIQEYRKQAAHAQFEQSLQDSCNAINELRRVQGMEPLYRCD